VPGGGTGYILDGNARDQPRGAGAHSKGLSIMCVGLSSRLNLRTEVDETLMPIRRWAAGPPMSRQRRPFERPNKVSSPSPSSPSISSANKTSLRPSPSGSSSWGMIGWYLTCNGHDSIQISKMNTTLIHVPGVHHKEVVCFSDERPEPFICPRSG